MLKLTLNLYPLNVVELLSFTIFKLLRPIFRCSSVFCTVSIFFCTRWLLKLFISSNVKQKYISEIFLT